MIRSETYQEKHKGLKKQYQLYDDYLQSSEEPMTFEQRTFFIEEMGRVLFLIHQIENMTFQESKRITDDWPMVISSRLNFNETDVLEKM